MLYMTYMEHFYTSDIYTGTFGPAALGVVRFYQAKLSRPNFTFMQCSQKSTDLIVFHLLYSRLFIVSGGFTGY